MTVQKMVFSVRQACLPIISSSEVFPIHRIYCIGRNYREHAIEMGHNPDREPPFFFHKPADAATTLNEIPFPPKKTSNNLHYEAELVVALGKKGRDINTTEKAQDLIFGYSVGCDLTRRDLQAEAKRLSRPWCIAKGFDYSAPMTPIVRKEEVTKSITDRKIELWVNEELKQSSPMSQMIWDIPEMIQYLSCYYTLQPGDLIMTGTPAGVGKLEVGDEVRISCGEGLPECEFVMVEPLEDL